MSKRRTMIEAQRVDESGKLIKVRVDAPNPDEPSPIAKPDIPSSVAIHTIADGDTSMEIADDLAHGIGVGTGDVVVIQFRFGVGSRHALSSGEAQGVLSSLLTGDVRIEGDTVIWTRQFELDGESIDLFDVNVQVCQAFQLYADTDTPDVEFAVHSYSSETELRLSAMSDSERRGLIDSAGVDADELRAIISMSEPRTQIAAIRHPRSPAGLLRRIVETGPILPAVNAKGVELKINATIRSAASSELARRAKLARKR